MNKILNSSLYGEVRKMNKYNIGDKLFYYNFERNNIIEIEVIAITFDEKNDIECRYNYLYKEGDLYPTFNECFMDARNIIRSNMEDLEYELEIKCMEKYEIPIDEEGGL